MSAMQLLSAALSSEGFIATVALKSGAQTRQKFYAAEDFQTAVDEAVQIAGKGYDTYFCTSTLVTNNNRRGENVQHVKVLKLDLDISASDNKKYASQADAVADLKRFCKETGFPKPTLVDSGYGIHVYWILRDAMSPDQAKLVSEKFKAVTAYRKLKTDPTVTADLVRILRMPDTFNYKDAANPKPTRVLTPVMQYELEDMVAIVEREYEKSGGTNDVAAPALGFAIPAHLQGITLDPTSRALLEGKPKKFSKILALSMKGHGCAQIKDIYENQAAVEEPRWRAGISIAQFCEDGPAAIHQLSEQHPTYDATETERKAASIKGPYTCQTFKQNWASTCEGCKFAGKIKSPIQIGEYIPMATAGDNMVLAQNKAVDAEEVAYVIPQYPFPYQRGKNGGVYLPQDDGENEVIVEVYKYDFYMVKRLKDETEGYIAQFRVHFPKDGVVDFTINASDIGSAEKLRDHLNSQGILLFDKEVSLMRGYVRCWFDSLSKAQEVDRVKTQFGWTDGMKTFVIGDREITGDGTRYSPAAPSISSLIKHMGRKGDVVEWRKVFNTYAMPGFEAHAFGALLGFGSVLLAFTPLKGALVNLMSPESGTGKSTVLKVICSMWGDPEGLMTSFKDTAAARTHRMGVLKNIPVCVDEVTTLNEEAIQDLVFSATQGKGKNRMSSSANAERINNTTWASITISSANANFREKLQAGKSGVEGELMRLMDVPVPETNILSKLEADRIFNALLDNYGWAGELFVKYVINNKDAVIRRINVEQEALDRDGKFSNKERFWSAVCACALVGGIISKDLGLHDIDMAKMRLWMLDYVQSLRDGVGQTTKQTEHDVLNEFINAHLGETLVVSSGTGATASMMPTILTQPRNTVLVRYEMDKELLFVLASEFKKFCKERNVYLEQFLNEMKDKGIYVETQTKRLAAGTNFPSPVMRSLVFNVPKETVPVETTP